MAITKPKKKPKIVTFDPKTSRLGVDTPESIYASVEDIRSALVECDPYKPITHDDNLWLLEVAKREAGNIIRYVAVIERMYALNEKPSLDERKEA